MSTRSLLKAIGSLLPEALRQPLRAARERLRTRRRPALTRSGGKALDCVIAYNRHGGYCLPLSSLHRPAAQAIMRGLEYEPQTLAFLARHCADGDVVHAGTYYGDFLPALSAALGPQSQVWAFEPNRENYRCARITIELNGLDNVTLAHAGLGDAPATLQMSTTDARGRALGGASRIHLQEGVAPAGTEAVRVLRLDDILPSERRVALIQLDVEGYEQKVLDGAMAIVRRHRPILVVETLPEAAWLAAHLQPLGYEVADRFHGNTVLRPTPRIRAAASASARGNE